MVAVNRSFLFRLFNLLMAVVVLTTSTGFGLVEHSCLMRGQTTVSINQHIALKPCAGCPEQKTTRAQQNLKKAKCCADRNAYQNVSFTASLVHLMAKSVKAMGDAVISGCVWAVNSFVAAIMSLLQSTSTAISVAVPLSGRSLLAFVQSLLL